MPQTPKKLIIAANTPSGMSNADVSSAVANALTKELKFSDVFVTTVDEEPATATVEAPVTASNEPAVGNGAADSATV